ncbi:class II glutamine amidotransferase [Streptomyces sp. SAI-229]|uniref:class II glutamine amidotransferase n=1 Tax=Streptomyces sp. SAI-229 TaxID=3377731 RepID=UPI003C7D856D
MVSQQPGVLGDLVAEDLDPSLALAREHGDGWGVALRARDRSVEITEDPGRVDTTPALRTLLGTSRTDAALPHLRMASQDFPVHRASTHPFGDRSVAFAHNGDFTPATGLDDVLGPDLLATAEGDTDSERFSLAVRRRMLAVRRRMTAVSAR